MAAATPPAPSQDPDANGAAWALWLGWTWVLLLVLAVVAELGGLDDLRLALDLQRHFAGAP